MKNVFFALAFMLVGSFAFASNEVVYEDLTLFGETEIHQTESTELIYFSEIKDSNLYGCTIVSGTQIISNGEIVFEVINTWHTDAYESCEAMWQAIADIIWQAF